MWDIILNNIMVDNTTKNYTWTLGMTEITCGNPSISLGKQTWLGMFPEKWRSCLYPDWITGKFTSLKNHQPLNAFDMVGICWCMSHMQWPALDASPRGLRGEIIDEGAVVAASPDFWVVIVGFPTMCWRSQWNPEEKAVMARKLVFSNIKIMN